MYIDLIVLVVLLAIVIIFFKKISSVIYFIVIIDIFLRILTFIKLNIPLKDMAAVIDTYIPSSIPLLVGRYISGIPYTVFSWLYLVVFIIFESYIIRTFWKKKK